MRVIASFLLLVAAVVQLLLGAALVLSSRNLVFKARVEAGAPSGGAGELASREKLQVMEQVGLQQTRTVGRRQLVLGVSAVAIALVLVVGGVLLTLNRARGALPLICLLASGDLALIMVMEGISVSAGVALGLVVCATLPLLFAPGTRGARPR